MECVKTAKPPDRGSPRGPVIRPSEERSVPRPDHEPLHELGASVLPVEAQRPQVPIEVTVRVARCPLGYRPMPLDHQGTVARFPAAGFVPLLQPVGDDGLAAPQHLLALVVGVVGVGGVLGEEGSYGRGVVSAPGVHVGVDPPLHVVMSQDTPPSATSESCCSIARTIPSGSGPTITPISCQISYATKSGAVHLPRSLDMTRAVRTSKNFILGNPNEAQAPSRAPKSRAALGGGSKICQDGDRAARE